MYERSAIVLEKYFNTICGFDKKVNLKTIYKDYKEIVEEIQNYQNIIQQEDEIINRFDEAANNIRKIQQEQKKIYKTNIKLEEDRNQLFENLDEDASSIEKKLIRIEEYLDRNNKRLQELRDEFLQAVTEFSERQTERNKYSRSRREEEAAHMQIIEKSDKDIKLIGIPELKELKEFINTDSTKEQEEIAEIMISNGKEEKVPFDENVIENAAKVRNQIAKKEAECYIIIFERMKRLLSEINNDDIKLDKYNKALRDISVKLAFLKAEKNYIVSFLDNERMTSINGSKAHKQLMLDACEKFELDIQQINNLYDLILKEITGKASKKSYKELYDKEYLKNIEEKEKNFAKEVTHINIKAGTIINSNYWRTEEIRNIYDVFQKEVSEKFEKDLSEYKLEELEEEPEEKIEETIEVKNKTIRKSILNDEEDEYEFDYDDEYEDDEYEDDEYEYEYEDDDEYEDDEDEYEEDDDEYEDEEDDDEYEDDEDEYEEDDDDEYEDDEDEDEYEEDDEDEYEDEDDEYEEDDDEYEDEDDVHEEIKRKINHMDDDLVVDTKRGKGIFNKFFKDKKD